MDSDVIISRHVKAKNCCLISLDHLIGILFSNIVALHEMIEVEQMVGTYIMYNSCQCFD